MDLGSDPGPTCPILALTHEEHLGAVPDPFGVLYGPGRENYEACGKKFTVKNDLRCTRLSMCITKIQCNMYCWCIFLVGRQADRQIRYNRSNDTRNPAAHHSGYFRHIKWLRSKSELFLPLWSDRCKREGQREERGGREVWVFRRL